MSSVTVHRTPARRGLQSRGLGHRWVVAVAALVAAGAHVPVIGPHLDEAPYMGILFILLTVTCLGIAAAICVRDSTTLYTAAVLTCGLAVLGYAATRLVAFPMLADDLGNWLEPLGVLSVASETVVVVAAVSAVLTRPRPASPLTPAATRPA